MKNKTSKLLSILLALVMVVGLMPLGQVAYAAGDELNNVVVSSDGVVTWDDFPGATQYMYIINNNSGGWWHSTTMDLKELCADYHLAAGNITLEISAGDSSNKEISKRSTVTWYNPTDYTVVSSYHVTTQPTGGSTTIGSDFDITFATDFTPKQVELYRGDTVGSGVFETTVGNTSGKVPKRTIEGTVSFHLKFTTETDEVIYSDVFSVTWGNYVITKQPTGGTVKIGEAFDISYATDVAPKAVKLYRGDVVGSGVFECELGATSGKVPERTLASTVAFYLGFEDDYGNVVYSDVFSITWENYSVTKQPTGGTDKPTLPQTGDESNVGLWIALMALSMVGFVGVASVGKKRRVQGRHSR